MSQLSPEAHALALAAEYARVVDAYHTEVRMININAERARIAATERFMAAQRDVTAQLAAIAPLVG